MAVTLKMARFGTKGVPYYRIVAAEKGTKRDGNFIEKIGTYNPMTDPATVKFVEERLHRWLSVGAQTTPLVRRLIIKTFPGLMEKREEHQLNKIRAARKARKTRAAARGGKTAKKSKK